MLDIWFLDIIAYAMVNPNLTCPYRKESDSLGAVLSADSITGFMRQQLLPTHDPKYQTLRVTEWWRIED